MKILIIKTSSLGDILHTFDAVSYLKQRYPNCQIDWIVEDRCANLVEVHPLINQVWVIASKKWKKNFFKKSTWKEVVSFRKALSTRDYDVIFDLQGNIKSALLLLQVHGKKKVGFGWKTVHEWPNALVTNSKINPPPGKNIREDYLAVVQGFFKDFSLFQREKNPLLLQLTDDQKDDLARYSALIPSSTILVSFGSAWKNKRLTSEVLIKILREKKGATFCFISGNAEEKKNAEELATHFPGSILIPPLPIPLLQHVMAHCDLLIGNDSFPLHLCATTSTPTLSFFGPSLAAKYCPIGEQHRSIQGKCLYNVLFEKTCPQLRTCKTGLCLKELNVD